MKILQTLKGTTKTRHSGYAQEADQVWEDFKVICEKKGLAKGRTLTLILKDWVLRENPRAL